MSEQDDRAAINQRLATLMGYKVEVRQYGLQRYPVPRAGRDYFELLDPSGQECVEPYEDADTCEIHDLASTEAEAWSYAPDYFRDAAASRQLVAWLAKDRARGHLFLRRLGELIRSDDQTEMHSPTWPSVADEALALMTASLPDIARAAYAATQS